MGGQPVPNFLHQGEDIGIHTAAGESALGANRMRRNFSVQRNIYKIACHQLPRGLGQRHDGGSDTGTDDYQACLLFHVSYLQQTAFVCILPVVGEVYSRR